MRADVDGVTRRCYFIIRREDETDGMAFFLFFQEVTVLGSFA